jgi:hypothetical protein
MHDREGLVSAFTPGQRVLWKPSGLIELGVAATVVRIGQGHGRVTILVDGQTRKKVVARWFLEVLR